MIKNRSLAGSGYGTHITPLIAAVLATKCDVIEMGMGDYSTPLLHEIIKYQRESLGSKRQIWSFDSDQGWLDNFLDLFNPWHLISFVRNWERDIPHISDISVIFIDHSPAERRTFDIVKYKDIAEIIVVHDTEKSNYYRYEPELSAFKFRFDYERYSKRTTLVSNTIDVTKIL